MSTNTAEVWKDIPWYVWHYMISNLWRVISLKHNKKRILSNRYNSLWYIQCILQDHWRTKQPMVHRLVCESFIPNPNNLPQVNHINWIKSDNNISNLEWVSSQDNIRHAYMTWLNKSTENNFFKKNHPSKGKFGKENKSSIPIIQYDLTMCIVKEWECTREIERELWFAHSHISDCCKWKLKTSYKFIWRYKI